MSQKKSRDKVHFGPAGDNTTGPKSLSDMTYVSNSLRRLIGAPEKHDSCSSSSSSSSSLLPPSPVPSSQQPLAPAFHPTFEVDQSTTVEQEPENPEEIAKRLRLNQSRPLINSQKTIESLKEENLNLKIQLHNLQQHLGKEPQQNFILEGKQDMVADLLNKNKQLKRQLEERDRRDEKVAEKKRSMMRDIECQTNLDRFNIDELLRDRIALKRIMEQRPTTEPTPGPNKLVVSNKQLALDEKEILATLYHVHGNLTTTLDKLKAKSDYH